MHRSKVTIVKEILENVMGQPGITVSKLCLNVNLGNKTLNGYLDQLSVGNFVEVQFVENRKIVKATIRTREMLFVLDKLPDDQALSEFL